jgi:Fe-S-cluster containining protein
MDLTPFFERYERLLNGGDQAFDRAGRECGPWMKCVPRCSDCCHAVFGLFLIEALYLQFHFAGLGRKERRAALLRAKKSETALGKLEGALKTAGLDPRATSDLLARSRARCSLLDEKNLCVLYPHRPLTCRVYGMPVVVQGKTRICGKAAFKKQHSYPPFDLDAAHRGLYLLSRDVLAAAGSADPEKAALVVSVPKALGTPVEAIISESFQ